MSTAYAIIAGVGPGTGASLARKFALTYPVALLARNPDNYTSLVEEINKSGGKAIGISTDVSSSSSIDSAIAEIKSQYGDKCAAAVFNASGPFARKSILELTEKEFTGGYEVSWAKYPGTLIFTGATASVKSNALMSAFSTGKYAMRALSQSIAREFAPKGVHVAHAIIDGVIDIPRTKEWLKDMPPEAKIEADAIAEAYWNLHTQSKRAFTNEIDIRPMLEKW
ncbi:unnamed protein product [Aureobasidium uvarum]|uniref:NAD(P)-binding protein n=1 Tax=Aureobasidium uvarum TaxID=2773716 RepID=A0A9N8KF34_9PEZI|nr:unnamed protein product [Aureobasidium uvarum]